MKVAEKYNSTKVVKLYKTTSSNYKRIDWEQRWPKNKEKKSSSKNQKQNMFFKSQRTRTLTKKFPENLIK